MTAAFRIILSDANVKGILVNIFGGIMRCDIVAEGVSLAMTYRQEYSSVVSRNGGDVGVLTRKLNDLVAAGAFRPQ